MKWTTAIVWGEMEVLDPGGTARLHGVLVERHTERSSFSLNHGPFWPPAKACYHLTKVANGEPMARPQPSFDRFCDELDAEVEWLRTIHKDDKDGSARADIETLRELRNKVARVSDRLGYGKVE